MARPVAPRFEITVLKDKAPPSDKTQVPTLSTIEFYRQGATAVNTVTVMPGIPNPVVEVRDVGRLEVGDTARVGATSSELGVTGVNGPTQIQVNNPGPHPVEVLGGTRLLPTNNRPNAYADPFCAVSLGSSLDSSATDGRASAFLSENRVDYEVVIAGQPTRLYTDGAGRMGRSDQRLWDLRDFRGDLQAALDALPAGGGTIFIPRGEWLLPNPITISKPQVTILGEGHGSVLKRAPGNTSDLITVVQSYFRLQDLTIDGAATAANPSGPSCVVVLGLGQSGTLVLGESFENVKFTRAARHGLWARDAIVLLAQNCQFDGNFGHGAMVETPSAPPTPTGATTTQFIGCSFSNNVDRGCFASSVAALMFLGCSFEGNAGGATNPSDYLGNGIEAESCVQIQVLSCVFRNPATLAPAGSFIALGSCLSSLVDGCYFDGGPNAAKRPKGGVGFNNSAWSRASNCTGYRLLNHVVWIDGASPDCVEFGNTEVEAAAAGTVTRIKSDALGLRLVGMSRRGVSAHSHDLSIFRPGSGDVTAGSLLWNEETGQLQIWDGASWKSILITL